jgi:hypothetical protein
MQREFLQKERNHFKRPSAEWLPEFLDRLAKPGDANVPSESGHSSQKHFNEIVSQ